MADTQVTDDAASAPPDAPARSGGTPISRLTKSFGGRRSRNGSSNGAAPSAPRRAQRNSPDRQPARTMLGRRRVRARRVRRTIRHIDPWSVFKIGIVFCLCMYGALLLSVTLLWNAAEGAGLLDNIESFFVEIGLFDDFEFKGDVMFRAAAIGGLVLAVASAAGLVLMTVIFNLISDLMGGIRVSVIEEDLAYVRPAAAGAAPDGDLPPPAPPTL